MASYHLAVKAVSRSTGRSAPAAAAYRSGDRLADERTGLVHDYTRRSGVEATAIVAPAGAAWAQDRAVLWNAAEAAEKRKDAKVAREYEVALPSELDAAGRLDLARRFAGALVARYGVVADIAVHRPGKEGDQRNWHAHVLTTTRAADATGLGAKTRVLDVASSAAAEIEALRALWAEQTNAALERAGASVRVDHRSHERRGIEAEPSERVATATYVMDRRGQGQGAEERAEIAAARGAVQAAGAEVINLEAERERRAAQAARREDPLDHYRALLAKAERGGNPMEVAQFRGWLSKAAELVKDGKIPSHHGTQIIQAGDAARMEWAEQDYRRRYPEEPALEAPAEVEQAGRPAISPDRAQQLAPFIEAMQRGELEKLDRQERAATAESGRMATDLSHALWSREEALREAERAEKWELTQRDKAEGAAQAVEDQRRASPLRGWLHDRGIWASETLQRAERQAETAEREHDQARYLLGRARDDLARRIDPEAERQARERIEAQKAREAGRLKEIAAAREAVNSPNWRREAEQQASHMLDVREIVSAGQVERSWGQTRFSHPPGLSAQEIDRRDAVLAEQPEVTKAVMEATAREQDRGMEMDL